MASGLKSDLLELRRVFPKTHERFRILKASADELTCRFVLDNETFCDVQGNITDMYPSEPPLWFAVSENEAINNGLDDVFATLKDTNGHIISQVKTLVSLLCRQHSLPMPSEFDRLSDSNSVADTNSDSGKESHDESAGSTEDDYEDDDDDDSELEAEAEELFKMMETVGDSTTVTNSGMEAENAQIIKRQNNLQFQKQSNSNSNKILLKELDTIYRSETYKNKTYSIELINDSLCEWKVNLMSVCFCSDSLLSTDLTKLMEQGLEATIQMRIMFSETFPFEPPFIQVTYPAIKGGHVLEAGALCMELLTKQGWSSAYSMENVLMQIASTFIAGNARVDFELTKVILKKPHNLEQAKKMFAHHEEHHKKNGWVTPAGQRNG